MPTNFKVTFFGRPELQISAVGQHILPGHPVHITKVDMVRWEQLAKGSSAFIAALSRITAAITRGIVNFRTDSWLHGHGQRHTCIGMQGDRINIFISVSIRYGLEGPNVPNCQ